MYLYSLYDKVSGFQNNFQKFVGDSSACRYYMRNIYAKPDDFEILCIASIQDPVVEDNAIKSGEVYTFFDTPRSVAWDSYRLPDNEAEAMSPFKMSKDEFLQEMSKKYDLVNSKH